MKQGIALLYARRDVGGGSTSFAVHLYRAMQMAGIDVKMYRLSDEHKDLPRKLAQYHGVNCYYITPDEARTLCTVVPTLLVGPEHSSKLPEPGLLSDLIINYGMRLVVHDPNEFMTSGHTTRDGVYDHLRDRSLIKRPICIRPTMREFFKDAHFIPHPYVRVFSGWQGSNLFERKAACSIARITFVKRTQLILEANRLLPKRLKVQLHGAENRLFTHFKLQKLFPEFRQGGYNLPMTHGVSARAAHEYTLAVDFTFFPHDGGGSQYTFMEAWDAGCVNVIHRDWLRYKGEMKDWGNCIAVDDAEHLANIIKRLENCRGHWRRNLIRTSRAGTHQLETVHDPVTVAKAYYKELTR